VLLHRIVFRPTFLAEARRVGWDGGGRAVEEKCFARARAGAEQPAGAARRPSGSGRQQPSRLSSTEVTFPLAPRRRFAGLPFGA
jgi:hypothetical protein